MATRRIADEPAYILHSYAFSESSLILEVFSRSHGRVVLLAKGAKKPTSNFRPVLLPLVPLRLTWSVGAGEGEVHALKGAEWAGGHVLPSGETLLAGLYVNELLLRLLARDDPHAGLFDLYAGVLRVLGSGDLPGAQGDGLLEAVLRAFELLLLRRLGLLPQLDVETATLAPVRSGGAYVLLPEGGLRLASAQERGACSGVQWLQLQQALESSEGYPALLRVCAPLAAELKPQLRTLLQ